MPSIEQQVELVKTLVNGIRGNTASLTAEQLARPSACAGWRSTMVARWRQTLWKARTSPFSARRTMIGTPAAATGIAENAPSWERSRHRKATAWC